MKANVLKVVVYVSKATQEISDDQLERLLFDSASNNESLGITGVLLFNEGTFFQYLEGPVDKVDALMAKIPLNPTHHCVNTLLEYKTQQRMFPDWSMALFKPRQSELLNLVNEEWWEFSGKQLSDAWSHSAGLNLLRGLCEKQK